MPASGKELTAGNLTVKARILHYVLAKTIINRYSNFAQILLYDMVLVWALIKKIKINWARYVAAHMYGSTGAGKPLPYGFLITKILKAFNVPLEGEFKLKSTSQTAKTSLEKCNLHLLEGVWYNKKFGDRSNKSRADFPEEIVPPAVAQREGPERYPQPPQEQGTASIITLLHNLEATMKDREDRWERRYAAMNDTLGAQGRLIQQMHNHIFAASSFPAGPTGEGATGAGTSMPPAPHGTGDYMFSPSEFFVGSPQLQQQQTHSGNLFTASLDERLNAAADPTSTDTPESTQQHHPPPPPQPHF